MDRYEVYKDSGVEWIGMLPSEWHVVALKMVSDGIQDGTHGTYERVTEGIPLLSSKNVTEKGLIISDNESVVSESDANDIVANGYPAKNDLLFCCVGTIGKSCLYELEEPLPFQRSVAFVRPGRLLCPSFLKHLAWSCVLHDQAEALQNKSIQGGLYLGLIGSLKMPLPSWLEQEAIADYLDAKTAEIDALVADCEREVELLREYRKAVISEAVTKGLDPDAPMKDSGVEWIGEIPEGWMLPKLGLLLLGMKDGTHSTHTRVDSGHVLLSAKNVRETKIVISDQESMIGEHDYQTIIACGYPAYGDVLLTTIGASIGRSVVYEFSEPYAFQRSVIFLRPDRSMVDPHYLCYELRSELMQSQMFERAAASAQDGIYAGDIARYRAVLPSLAEQHAIVAYLNKKIAEIDSLIEAKQTMADKLREYRKSLISEAVTGKFKVPGVK